MGLIGKGVPSYTSVDGVNWSQISTYWYCDAQAHGNGGFIHISNETYGAVYWVSSSDKLTGATSWVDKGNFSSIEKTPTRALGYCNGKWCAITWSGKFITSYDNGSNWTVESLSGASPGDVTGTTSEWYSVIYGFGRYWAICRGDNTGDNSRIVFSRDGKTWYKADAALGTICGTSGWFRGLGFNGTRFVSASDDGYFAYGDCNGSITFTNISSGMVNNNTAYKVTEKKEFFIESSQISDTQTNGNYTITFNATNLRLISAEIMNRLYVKVTPTVSKSGNVFTLNAKVPFAVPVYVSGSNAKVTYTTAASGSSTFESFSHSHSFQATPEKVRYKKTFDSNGNPVYTVTLTPTNVTFGTPQVGTVETKTASVSGLSLDSSSNNLSGSFSNDGVTFNYSTTKPSDTTGTATVSNGTITCPTGSVLHVKAVPSGSVTFSNPNNLGETDINGATIASGVTASSGQAISITDKQTFTFPGSCFRLKWPAVYSSEKLKFSLQNARILSVVLKNQCLSLSGLRSGYVVDSRDAAIDFSYSTGSTGIYNDWMYLIQGGELIYKITNPWLKDIRLHVSVQDSRGTSSSSRKATLYYYPSDTETATFRATTKNVYEEDFYGVVRSSDRRFLSIVGASSGGWYYIYSFSVYNLNDCIMNMSNTSDTTTGLYTTNGNLINFEGRGDLDVIISPYGTITFNCENENLTAHELYKEYNFCIEPSQMTDLGNGYQKVTFTTTGNVTVTATYEMKRQTQVTVTKPSNVAFATINVTGHKKEMVWTVSESQVAGYPAGGDGFRFDGTRVYRANTNTYGNGEISYSDDFGKTWENLEGIELRSGFRHGDLPNAISFTCNYDDMHVCYDNKHYIVLQDQFSVASDMAANFEAGFKWSRDKNATVKYMQIFDKGRVATSNDGFTWSPSTLSLPESDCFFWNGVYYVNGIWYTLTAGAANMYWCTSNDGVNWETSTSTKANASDWNTGNYLGLAYGSNLMMIMSYAGRFVGTSRDFKTVNWRANSASLGLGIEGIRDICYANGNFIIGQMDSGIAYTTFHDGVMWSGSGSSAREFGISRDINQNISAVIKNTDSSSNVVNCSNMTITGISLTYEKIIPLNPSMVIEYKKIMLPENSAYIDYSTNPCTPFLSELHSEFYTAENAWYYDEEEGFPVNKKTSTFYGDFLLSFQGDHSSIYYADDWLEMYHYSADGWNQYLDYKIRTYNAMGLTRTCTLFDNFVFGKFHNFNEYHNIHGKLSYIMQTVTLPINVALWAGMSGTALHSYQWQSDASGNWNGKDATAAVKEVTKRACTKLKTDHKNNLRVYLIKFRKQTQYKHPVTQTATDFDYSYLNSCATSTSQPYLYENVTDGNGLKTALDAIYENIKSWANRTEATNV